MKKSIKIPLYILLFLLFFIIGFPKENLYYYFEQKAKNENWIISQETITSQVFSLDVDKGFISYKRDSFFSFDSMTFSLLGVSIKNISLYDENKKVYVPSLQSLKVRLSITNPRELTIHGRGLIGEVVGYIDIVDKKIVFNLNATKYMKKNFRSFLDNMKLEKGKYYYDYKL